MDQDELREIRENLKEISKEVQDVGRMIGSARMLGPTREPDPRFDLDGLKSLSKTLKRHSKTINVYVKLLKESQ